MPSIIDPLTLYIDDLPGIWSPVQWELTPQERTHEIETQATASLLHVIDAPEAMLRMLLGETEIIRAYEPPKGYNPELQGEWNPDIITFQFRRPIRLENVERTPELLSVLYDFGELGHWLIEIEEEKVRIERV